MYNESDQLTVAQLTRSESWAGRRLLAALNHLQHSNMGSSMDMKFQQKQLQEREQRRTELFGSITKSTIETTDSTTSSLTKNGKVRAMFNERRRGAGIDRSQPLKPITASATTTTSSKTSTGLRVNGVNTAPSNTTISKTRVTATQNNVKRAAAGKEVIQAVNERSSMDVNDVGIKRSLSRDNTFDSTQSDKSDDHRNNNNFHNSTNGIDNIMKFMENKNYNNNDYLNEMTSKLEITSPVSEINSEKNNNKIKKSTTVLAPVKTKKTVPASVSPISTFPRGSTLATNSKERRNMDSLRTTTKVQVPPTVNKVKLSSKKTSSTPVKLTQSITQMNQAPREVPPAAGMKTCPYCHRNFLEERLAKHEAVCAKLSTAKRKIFDASQHRVRGTEAEKYLKKGNSRTVSSKPSAQSNVSAAAGLRASNANSALKKNNWRQKHEEFIAAIRAAKELKAHLARGGKLSDLPPPPPSENPDYIQCPHCGRRFNEAAAERHIPKCATMLHNKPKPGAQARTSLNKRR